MAMARTIERGIYKNYMEGKPYRQYYTFDNDKATLKSKDSIDNFGIKYVTYNTLPRIITAVGSSADTQEITKLKSIYTELLSVATNMVAHTKYIKDEFTKYEYISYGQYTS
jgi:hypothetical protein